MTDRTRRRLLAGAFALAAMAGCASHVNPTVSETPDTTTQPDSLADWERSTDCDRMHDSVVSVEAVIEDPGADSAPFAFAELSSEERSILGTVTEEGGYGTCDPGDAFHRFLDRIRDASDRRLTLERDGVHYRLYVEYGDEVYSY